MEIEEITLTPEQYIEELKKVQHTLEGVKEDLDRAIYKMERRIETGYENLEKESRLATLAAKAIIQMEDGNLLKIGTAKIEY